MYIMSNSMPQVKSEDFKKNYEAALENLMARSTEDRLDLKCLVEAFTSISSGLLKTIEVHMQEMKCSTLLSYEEYEVLLEDMVAITQTLFDHSFHLLELVEQDESGIDSECQCPVCQSQRAKEQEKVGVV